MRRSPEALKEQLTEKGITVYCNAMVEEIQQEEGLVCTVRHLTDETTQIKTNQVVVAVGRTPYTEGLLGEDMTLQMEHGRPVVNADFETSESGIYAIGDVSAKTAGPCGYGPGNLRH